MNETEAHGFALAHVTRTLQIVYYTFDRPALRCALRGTTEQDRLRVGNAVDDVMSVVIRRREEEPSPEELAGDFPAIALLAACRPPPGRMAACWLPKLILSLQTAERYAYDHFASTVHKLYAHPGSIALAHAIRGRSDADATLIYRAVRRLIYWLQDRAATMQWDRRTRSVRFDMPWARVDHQVLDTVADRLGDLDRPAATLAACREQLANRLSDLADVAGARELALMTVIRTDGK